MMKHIHVTPLAAESLGVRSMCTLIETSDVKILLDAGVSLCPRRFGLPPHPGEYNAIVRCRQSIAEAAEESEIVTVSHYHFDHHMPSFEDWLCNWTKADETARQIYEGKTVLVKNPRANVNFSQRRRGWMFQQTSGKCAKKLQSADKESFVYGKTRLRFSEPVYHGAEDTFLGWTLMSVIECQDEKFMFAPDVQGPISKHTLLLVMNEKPNLLIIGGPPLYLAGFKVDESQIQLGFQSLLEIAKAVPVTILEHHILRDESWRDKAKDVFDTAKRAGNKVMTAAELLGKKETCLEASRKQLYIDVPPSKGFQKWMRMDDEAKKRAKPPI
jgi:hypothetical protein